MNQGVKYLCMMGQRQGKPGLSDDPVWGQDGRKWIEIRGKIRLLSRSNIGKQTEMVGCG